MTVIINVQALEEDTPAQMDVMYNLCSSPEHLLSLKRVCLSKATHFLLTPTVMAVGLFSAIEHNQPTVMDHLLKTLKDRKTNLSLTDLRCLLNLAFEKEDKELILYLNQHLDLINICVNHPTDETIQIGNNGRVIHSYVARSESYIFAASTAKTKMLSYSFDVVLHTIKQDNLSHMELLMDYTKEICPSAIEAFFINACELQRVQIIQKLVCHEKTAPVVASSQAINRYLLDTTENKDTKDFVHKWKNSLHLKGKLDEALSSNTHIGKKLKI